MIEYTSGNILKCEADALVNTVNCVGVMGRGIALQFKNAFPENFKAYEAACKREAVQPGRMFVYETGQLTPPRFIVNFPTKRHWRGKSRMEDIESGLADLVKVIRDKGIRSIAIPPLGSGLGGLDWNEVRPRIERALAGLTDVQVLVFEPNGAPASDKMSHVREVPKMTAGRAALVELIQRYLGGLLDPFVTLLEIHKLMYFMQEAGEPLRLTYVKHHYGPYAENLRHVLRAVEGHLIAGYADGGDAPDKPLSLVPGAVEEAKDYLDQHEISRARFERVTRLVEGFESPYGLELLATVHWVMSREGATQHDSVARRVYDWNARKQQFTPRQLAIAEERLKSQGWLSPEAMAPH
ncbi:macro domain-containing protein [Acidithiobacillus ferrianus]|uniref:Appr-1-p processing protein n=2 Tax=Acidithiobacillus ferrianus TaxID=2678518 RepID=A0A845U6T4_9PROT|nr:macro domain-containing protein [Acidithiobacillus ferrianus]MDA8119871.1 macro domain-containing protein [Gammaproteobacteria bacterium]NDU43372.1 Appr-1-p processing protein [Acidithiobacillus ferrianus]